VGSVYRVTGWPLWDLPRWLRLLIAVLVPAYGAAIAAAAAVTRIRAGDLRLFAVLLVCTIVSIEMTRRIGEPTGFVRDAYAIWDLPCAVLLPPLYVMVLVAAKITLTQVRVRHGILHRRLYSAAVIGLSYAAASVIFRAAQPALGAEPGLATSTRAALWTLLVVACGVLRLILNDTLVGLAVKAADPQYNLRQDMTSAEALIGDAAELCLGILVTFAAAHSMLVPFYALPLVIWQQRSVRHAQLARAARFDRKTGLLNDSTWRSEAADELARAARTRTPVAVGILDVDFFKKVNDTYGHQAGDAVLAAVAATTMGTLREGDVVGRVGGEEFAFLLPYTPADEAIEVAERLRQVIPRISIPAPRPGIPAPQSVTVSIGVATAGDVTWSLEEFLERADRALYAAKDGGRNRVFTISADTPGGYPRPGAGHRDGSGP
jgi:diguanylate cyclase (GGDEF)-like protein